MAQDTIGREISSVQTIGAESSAVPNKPFSYDRAMAIETGVIQEKIKPFTMDENKSKEKLYLILAYYDSLVENGEDEKDWEFFRGTTQGLYDHVKLMMTSDKRFDAMRSKIFVDSPSITIGSANTSVFRIMLELREKGRVVDDTSFDIRDYYWDEGDIEQEG